VAMKSRRPLGMVHENQRITRVKSMWNKGECVTTTEIAASFGE